MRHASTRLIGLALLAVLAACSTTGGQRFGEPNPHEKVGRPYQVNGIWYVPKEDPDYDRIGFASWYGPGFHGRLTANGEVFDEDRLTAAHPTLPLPSIVEVTNPNNGRRVLVRVNDRGPFANNRIIDLSREAARRLGTLEQGVATVRVRYVGRARLEDAIVATGERERGQALYAALPRSPGLKPVRPPEALPDETDVILADLDTTVLDGARPVSAATPLAYFVQVGAFASTGNAAAAAARLPEDKPVALENRDAGGRRLTLVRVGPFAHPLSAQEALDQARTLGFADALIVEEAVN